MDVHSYSSLGNHFFHFYMALAVVPAVESLHLQETGIALSKVKLLHHPVSSVFRKPYSPQNTYQSKRN